MLFLDQTVRELALRNQELISEDSYSLSVYEKAGKLPASELKVRIKSHILQGLRSHPSLASLAKLHEIIVKHALELVNELDRREQGLAIFIQFNAAALDRTSQRTDDHSEHILLSQILPLYDEPPTHVSVGRIFDFTILFRIARRTPLGIIVQIDNEEAKVHTLRGNNSEMVEELTNPYNEPTENEYLEIHRSSGSKKVIHGTGSENVARRQKSANQAFWEDVSEIVENQLDTTTRWRNLVIFASKNYQPNLETWVKNGFAKKLPNPPLVRYKIINVTEELYRQAAEEINNFSQEHIKKDFLNDREQYENFVHGWKAVTDAARESRVEKLYLPLVPQSQQKRVGFILDQMLPYSFPVKDAKRVSNLLPWLTLTVIANGGQIIMSKVLTDISKEPISAKLRY